jgi:hypothetical protein
MDSYFVAFTIPLVDICLNFDCSMIVKFFLKGWQKTCHHSLIKKESLPSTKPEKKTFDGITLATLQDSNP